MTELRRAGHCHTKKNKQMNRIVSISLLIGLCLLLAGFRQSGADRIMMQMSSQSLHKGKRADVRAELFYRAYDGRLITRYISPVDYVMSTNNKGELAIYSEKDNTVYREQSIDYSSENNLIYFFLSGLVQDLGLRQLGFQLRDTEFTGGLVRTTWFPPPNMYQMFSYIELVHENQLPIYAGYYDSSNKLVKKVYYTDYAYFSEIVMPLTVTEFNYLPGNDSIVNRIRYSDVRFNRMADSPWFNFVIPEDAKILE